ncbi:MAG TPA: ATP-binding cassette domain-containing protein [Flavobacteriales bacterium]|nr:ATP-binding cassette domain-containing protein [Flavobacteriales bacterium]
MISVKGLSKKFDGKVVVKNINLDFEPGNVYGIVGENGAGKTTLFRCLAGLETYEGIISCATGALKNNLGFLPADLFFFSKITGMEYIRLLCNARKKNIQHIERKNIFDLPLGQYASTYSTGMQKKLALTAILLQENDYFILDEPFNGVDIQSNILIAEIILELKKLGKTIVLSSHIFSTLSTTCDMLHLIHNGSISHSVKKEDFNQLEDQMKKIIIGDKIERLHLK